MIFWLLLTVNSITFGALLFLLAAGFSLIFGLMRIPNLTHGSLFMLGAYFGATFVNGMLGTYFNFWIAALMAAALVAAFGALIERLLLRQVVGTAAGAGAGDARHIVHGRRCLPDGLGRRSDRDCRRRKACSASSASGRWCFPLYRIAVIGIAAVVGVGTVAAARQDASRRHDPRRR